MESRQISTTARAAEEILREAPPTQLDVRGATRQRTCRNGTQQTYPGDVVELRRTDAIRGQRLWPARDITPELAAAVTLAPAMPGAACTGMHKLFDLAATGNADAQRQALTVCSGCRQRARCAEWADTLTGRERRDLGVVGGLAPVVPVKCQSEATSETRIAGAERLSARRKARRGTPVLDRQQRAAQRARIERRRRERRVAREAATRAAG